MKDNVFRIIKVVFFLFCMFLVIYGQQTVGKTLFINAVNWACWPPLFTLEL